MNLQEGIKQTGKPFEIKDCGRDELPKFFKELGFKVGAEVGVYKAAYSELFCKEGFKFYAIDPWMAYQGAGRTQQEQDRQDFLFGHAGRVLAPYPDCTLVRKTSMGALADFEDGSLDFVYIDGDHEFSHVAADIVEWTKKVKKGGIVSGHDYFSTAIGASNVVCHVGPTINLFVKLYGIENFWVFGRSKPIEDEKKDDRYLSWMFFKN